MNSRYKQLFCVKKRIYNFPSLALETNNLFCLKHLISNTPSLAQVFILFNSTENWLKEVWKSPVGRLKYTKDHISISKQKKLINVVLNDIL